MTEHATPAGHFVPRLFKRASPSEAEAAPRRFTRVRRALAYALSPQVLLGGVVAFVATESVDAYKAYRVETRADVASVRELIIKHMNPLPMTAADTGRVVVQITTYFALYESSEARQLLSRAVGELSDLKARQQIEERSAAEAAAARLAAEEAQAKSEAARREAERLISEAAAEAERKMAEARSIEAAKAAQVAAARSAERQREVAVLERRSKDQVRHVTRSLRLD